MLRDAAVFSASGRDFTWDDVVRAARVWGDWQALEGKTGQLAARERSAGGAGRPSQAEVTSAANAFRYAHNLLAADELKQWLAHWEITIEDWQAYVRRSLLRGDTAEQPESTVAAVDLERATWAQAVCSGVLASFARRLAEQVAVHERVGGTELQSLTDEAVRSLTEETNRFCAAETTEQAIAAELHANVLGWTRVDCRYLTHGNEGVIREAALCVTEDGRDIADVAADAAIELHAGSFHLDDVDPSLRTRLLAASQGDLVGPVLVDQRHWLITVDRKAVPDAGDAALRERAQKRIVQRALAAEVSRRVRWHEIL